MSTDFKLVEKEENGQKISPVLPEHVKNYLIDNDYIIWKLTQLKTHSKKLFDHSINTCCISLITYYGYTFMNQQGMVDAMLVEKIIASSLLHSVGLLKTDPKKLEKKRYEIAPTNLSDFYQHPLEGFKLIKSENIRHELTEDILQSILNHEERVDGSGSPRGLSGNDLDFMTRLLSISNYFNLLISDELSAKPRPYRDYITRLRLEKTKFDEALLESIDLSFKHLFQP